MSSKFVFRILFDFLFSIFLSIVNESQLQVSVIKGLYYSFFDGYYINVIISKTLKVLSYIKHGTKVSIFNQLWLEQIQNKFYAAFFVLQPVLPHN